MKKKEEEYNMALQIITGTSGSGKTYYASHMIVEEAIANPNTTYYVVVPEQLNLSMQQDFLKISPTHTLFNIDVVSFERLAERIITRCGMELPELVDDTGKCLLLRKVAGDVRDDLKVFKRPITKPGFIQLLKSMLSELLQYDITEQKLEELSKADKMPAGLSEKLQDMFLVYRAFNEAMEEGVPKEGLLTYVNSILPKAGHIKESVFLFDGFTGFTPLQEKLVESLLSLSKMVYVTVTVDRNTLNAKKVDSFELFYMSHITIDGLYRCAEHAKTKVLSPVIMEGNKRTKKPDLIFLEKNLFGKEPAFYEDEPENIHLVGMENPLNEVRCVAEEIYHLVSQKGYRYRDIAVISGNMEAYIPHISRVFTQAGFSYYMDTKKDIHDMPVISYLLYAIEAVRWNADYENMFSFLKTGIILNQEECSILENYVLAKGIRGFSSWTREWKREMKNMAGYTMPQINGIREKAIKNLLPLRDVMQNDDSTVIDVLSTLVTMMQDDNVSDYIEQKKEWYAEIGNVVREKMYEQLGDKIMDVFDQFAQTLGNKHLAVSEYHDILLAGFSEIKAGVIPATSDCIIVGDMERTREEHVKILFFLGFNEGNVPTLDSKVDLLNKQDREILLNEYEVGLTPSLESRQSFQKYYFYLVSTKASEHLYITFPELDNQGKSINQSSYLREIYQRFPGISETFEEPGKYYINDATMLDMFGMEVRNVPENGISERMREISADLWSRKANREKMAEMIERAFFTYQPENIGMERAKALYGTTINASATRLETAASCPFSHFLKYGLGISERDIYEVSQKDIGSVYHIVLEEFFKATKEKSVNWMEISAEDRREHIHSCMEEISENYKDSLFKSTEKNKYFSNRICTVVDNTVDVLAKQIKQAGYEVKDVEVTFTGKESPTLNLPLDNGGNLVMSGRVDRLDIKEIENNIMYAKVIDYKTGETTFDATLAYNGLQLQLVYMDAAKGIVQKAYPEKSVHSGGFAYFHIKDKYIETDGTESSEQLEAKLLKEMEMTGLVNLAAEPESKKTGVEEERLTAIQTHVKNEVKRIGNKIANGDVETSPYKRNNKTSCIYCPYKAVCSFESGVNGYKYRTLREVSKEEF